MKGILLSKFSVRGIKNLENWATLFFYKKTFSKEVSSKGYNVKGVYGENGVGKSGLVTSMKIFKNIITDPGYLKKTIVQQKLEKLINKKTGYLEFDVEYYVDLKKKRNVYRYQLKIKKGLYGEFIIEKERLQYKSVGSHTDKMTEVYSVNEGEINRIKANEELRGVLQERTKNLLSESSLVSLYIAKVIMPEKDKMMDDIEQIDIVFLFVFGCSIHVYLEDEDEHNAYFLNNAIDSINDLFYLEKYSIVKGIVKSTHVVEKAFVLPLFPGTMMVPKEELDAFEQQVEKLKGFIKIFKNELIDIELVKRDDKEYYPCELVLHYKDYSVNAEFESTGIKKLIKIYSYIQKMVEGEIVFVDELDSNLHDVYLCALIEYLMEYGKGQLCFTTHNIGPMDILKRNKMSIDFLSINNTIYSWKTSGNYSPSKLYRGGMIAGSPFNVDSIDFINAF